MIMVQSTLRTVQRRFAMIQPDAFFGVFARLASVSIASVVIGLAAHSALANFVAGIRLIFYKPFWMGGRLQIMALTGLETGIVREVSLGYTTSYTKKQIKDELLH